jgi:hypothetical protein
MQFIMVFLFYKVTGDFQMPSFNISNYIDKVPGSVTHSAICFFPLSCDDGHGDYNRSYDKGYDDFDYADYSTAKEDNNFRTQQKKKRKTEKQIIEDILNRWD